MLTKSRSEPCQCRQCLRDREETLYGIPVELTRMLVCPKCGNKRCPHVTNHRFSCTDSNEPGLAPVEAQKKGVVQVHEQQAAPTDELQLMRSFLASKGLTAEYAVYRVDVLQKEQAEHKREVAHRLMKLTELGVVFIKDQNDPEFWSWRHTTSSAYRYRTRAGAIAGAWGALSHLVK